HCLSLIRPSPSSTLFPTRRSSDLLDGFFTVGDAGYLDEDGFLFLSDRKADMIISGGVNIYPAEIEAVFVTHPKVQDVAIFGVPKDRKSTRLNSSHVTISYAVFCLK